MHATMVHRSFVTICAYCIKFRSNRLTHVKTAREKIGHIRIRKSLSVEFTFQKMRAKFLKLPLNCRLHEALHCRHVRLTTTRDKHARFMLPSIEGPSHVAQLCTRATMLQTKATSHSYGEIIQSNNQSINQ